MDNLQTAPTTAAPAPARGSALVAGASGLVGRALVARLLAAEPARGYASIHTLVRRPLTWPPGAASGAASGAPSAPRRLVEHVADFARLARAQGEPAVPDLPALEDAYIALGTTIKVAGSREAFRAVDFDAVMTSARVARQAGARRLAVVTAMGANPKSAVFYNRVKGEVEDALATLGFEVLMIARPSFLVGDRLSLGQPERPGERRALQLSRWLGPLIPPNLRPIAADDVAAAMIAGLQRLTPGRHVVLSGELSRVARHTR